MDVDRDKGRETRLVVADGDRLVDQVADLEQLGVQHRLGVPTGERRVSPRERNNRKQRTETRHALLGPLLLLDGVLQDDLLLHQVVALLTGLLLLADGLLQLAELAAELGHVEAHCPTK